MSLDMKIKKNLGGFQLDVELHAGNETLALLGASGCGKNETDRAGKTTSFFLHFQFPLYRKFN